MPVLQKQLSWWDKRYGKNAICPIYRIRLRPGCDKNGLSYTVKLPCKHSFYRSALINLVLFQTDYTPCCPLCRKDFDPLIPFVL